MEVIGIIVIIIVLGVFALWRKAGRGVFRTREQLKQPLDQLLNNMEDGFVIFTHAKSEKFLQFSKYKSGLELGFPIVEWSKSFETVFIEYCRSKGVAIQERTGSDNTNFIDVDFGKNTQEAYEFLLGAFSNVFKVPMEDGYHVFLDGNAS